MTEPEKPGPPTEQEMTLVDRVIRYCLENKLVVVLFVVCLLLGGIVVAPFNWDMGGWLPRDPVPVDAIPNIGPNQQIVFTRWPGRSPRDVEDQVTYPLTVSLLGIPGVKTIRSKSRFGFSMVLIIFEENVDFYWSRSRVVTKLNSLPAGTLPEGVQPSLGPDATALGQVYWYTLEGRGPDGEPTGGWSQKRLRTIQDWYVRYELMSATGISEVASVGGYQKEYQINVDPHALQTHDVTLTEVFKAVRQSNQDVGARTMEVNSVEYLIRSLGFIEDVDDIRNTVVKTRDNTPIYIKDLGRVTTGPAPRRGALDKAGAPAVGGVATVRYGYNPLEGIQNLKKRIEKVETGLPRKAVIDWDKVSRKEVTSFASQHDFEAFNGPDLNQEAWKTWLTMAEQEDWPEWVTMSHVEIVPFYDRSNLIQRTLATLNDTIFLQILVTVIVVVSMVYHLRTSILISAVLPLAVLMVFIIMKVWGVPANIVSLSGIAIAVGTMVDKGIFICENIHTHLERPRPEERSGLDVVYGASSEIGGAVFTAVATTVVGFLPVFTMTGAEGKLFGPLAFTKVFACIAVLVVAFTVVPTAALWLFTGEVGFKRFRRAFRLLVMAALIVVAAWFRWWLGIVVAAGGAGFLLRSYVPDTVRKVVPWIINALAILLGVVLLSYHWQPLGAGKGMLQNTLFVGGLVGGLMAFFHLVKVFYNRILRWALRHKMAFLSIPAAVMLVALTAWLGFGTIFGFIPRMAGRAGVQQKKIRESPLWKVASREFPGFESEFMPPLNEGTFLYMPVTMPHASIGEAMDQLQKVDKAINSVPEVSQVVGKIGRVSSPLDPAPVSMVETVIQYKSEYITDEDGRRKKFRYRSDKQEFVRDQDGELIPDPNGRPYRQWRDSIRTPDDIWQEIVDAAKQVPGLTVAPKLMPIKTRVVMLQSGMRAPLGIKVYGQDLKNIEEVALQLEKYLKQVSTVQPGAVSADRLFGKPYLEIDLNRQKLARYGVSVQKAQNIIEVALGGRQITRTVEGRKRFRVAVRYKRELRDRPDKLGNVLVSTSEGAQVPLKQMADIRYRRGATVIKSEDTSLVGYVVFDMKSGHTSMEVVQDVRDFLQEKRESGEFTMPEGLHYEFAGTYKNQVRARRTLSIVLPLALFIIFLILYFQFHSVLTTLLVYSAIFLASAGGFLLLWLYGQPWFMDFQMFGVNMRKLFHIGPVDMSTAIWVGFLAMFGIASDNTVVIATYLDYRFEESTPRTPESIRQAAVEGASRPIRPCLMTTATTVLALLPVLTSTGSGSNVMVPMALPSFGGMFVVLLSFFVVPVLYSAVEEVRLMFSETDGEPGSE